MSAVPLPDITMQAGGDRGMEIRFHSAAEGGEVTDITVWRNYLYYRDLAERLEQQLATARQQQASYWPVREI